MCYVEVAERRRGILFHSSLYLMWIQKINKIKSSLSSLNTVSGVTSRDAPEPQNEVLAGTGICRN